MSSGYWSSLRPFEKRVVVGFGALFFIVLNFLFVIPHFSDLAAVNDRMGDAQRKLGRYQNEINKTNEYAAGLRKFEGENSDVPAEEQSIQFANAVNISRTKRRAHFLSRSYQYSDQPVLSGKNSKPGRSSWRATIGRFSVQPWLRKFPGPRA
jgi:hypothetical protein